MDRVWIQMGEKQENYLFSSFSQNLKGIGKEHREADSHGGWIICMAHKIGRGTAGHGHGCRSEGVCPRAWEHHFVNSHLCSAKVVPTLPYSPLLLHPVCTHSESMAQRLSHVGCLGAVSQLHQYNLTRKEAVSSFFS